MAGFPLIFLTNRAFCHPFFYIRFEARPIENFLYPFIRSFSA
uniref:Uncharacterized protein n=1 Tax=Triticum urartu TaxID=4572 RepID=A0A8R7PJE9_TRIUA